MPELLVDPKEKVGVNLIDIEDKEVGHLCPRPDLPYRDPDPGQPDPIIVLTVNVVHQGRSHRLQSLLHLRTLLRQDQDQYQTPVSLRDVNIQVENRLFGHWDSVLFC